MDPILHNAASQGDVQILKDLIQNQSKVLNSVTPRGNTALHMAAWFNHKLFVDEVLENCKILLILTNSEGDTPLHIAARVGHSEVVASLVKHAAKWPVDIEHGEVDPLRITNNLGNTALHEAVMNHHSNIAIDLLSAEPTTVYMMNKKRETPLHIAAREGLEEVVNEILKHSWVPGQEEQKPPLPGTGSPLHQAVIGGHHAIVEKLLKERKDFIPVNDEQGNNALHYAAERNNAQMVELLLVNERTLAYHKNVEGRSPLQVAAEKNSSFAIMEILKRCPDAMELVDKDGWNALHIAVNSGSVKALKCLLTSIKGEEMINQGDKDGNTPLHLAVKNSRFHSTLALLKDERVDLCTLNNMGQTPRKIIELSEDKGTYEMYILEKLKKSEKKRYKNRRRLPESPGTVRTRSSFKKGMSNVDDNFKHCVETYTLVTALITTVSFAATFTMPGGYDQKLGFALLAKNPAFKVFVISDTIAMCSSLLVVFCFIWAWSDPLQFRYKQLVWGHRLTVVAAVAMLVALMSAVYAVLETQCQWVAIIVCFICCSAPFLLYAILGQEMFFIPFWS